MPFVIFIIGVIIILGIIYAYFKYNICKNNTFLPMLSIVLVSFILYNTQYTNIFDIMIYMTPVLCVFLLFILSKIFHTDYTLKEYIIIFFITIPTSLTFNMLCYGWNSVIFW